MEKNTGKNELRLTALALSTLAKKTLCWSWVLSQNFPLHPAAAATPTRLFIKQISPRKIPGLQAALPTAGEASPDTTIRLFCHRQLGEVFFYYFSTSLRAWDTPLRAAPPPTPQAAASRPAQPPPAPRPPDPRFPPAPRSPPGAHGALCTPRSASGAPASPGGEEKEGGGRRQAGGHRWPRRGAAEAVLPRAGRCEGIGPPPPPLPAPRLPLRGPEGRWGGRGEEGARAPLAPTAPHGREGP